MQQPNLVIPLKQIRPVHLEATGHKAYNLSVLMQQGVAVPVGFCLRSPAYEQHIRENGLQQGIQKAIHDAGPGRAQTLTRLRELITAAPLAHMTQATIVQAYETLPKGVVAVRSSATAEDSPTQSFAGQYETVLNVGNLEACLAAVKQCWASVWTDRPSISMPIRGW